MADTKKRKAKNCSEKNKGDPKGPIALGKELETEELCSETVPILPAKEIFEQLKKMPVMFDPIRRVNKRTGEITIIKYEEWKRATEKLERNGRNHKKKNGVVSNGKHNKKRKDKVARSTKYTKP